MKVLSVAALLFACAVAAAGQAPPTVWDGVYTLEQATRGAMTYRERCAACHGDALQGGEAAPALVGDVFNSTWEGVPLGVCSTVRGARCRMTRRDR